MKLDLKPVTDPNERIAAILEYRKEYKSKLSEADREKSIGHFYQNPKNDKFANIFYDQSEMEAQFQRSLIIAAKRTKKHELQATASAFAQWVFWLYHRPDILKRESVSEISRTERDYILTEDDKFHKTMGVFSEQSIEKLKLWINDKFPRTMSSQWKLIFVDLRDESFRIFYASRLFINGKPLRCVPDVVLRNRVTGDVIIIERKATSVPEEKVPPMGWANLKVQLWCYSWIDDWLDAPNVYLIGEIWNMPTYKISKNGNLEWNFLRMDIFPRWQRSDPCFDSDCRSLFELYGGEILG